MTDYLLIIKRNVVTPIVIAIVILVALLLSIGETKDGLFLGFVILANVLIAVVQEIRAKYALKKLELLTTPKARLVRTGGEVEEVALEALRLGDVVALEAGDQIPADGEVLESKGLEVDESLLTGESLTVRKKAGESVYAASFAVAGTAIFKVTALGDATRSGSITKTLKRYQPTLTPLQKKIARVIEVTTVLAIILIALVWVVYSWQGFAYADILKTIAAGVIVVVPEGLLLASSVLLAFGALKMAQAQVLPQKLSAIEAMALTDVLCTDKTGTLTSSELRVKEVRPLGEAEKLQLEADLAVLAAESSSGSALGKALAAAFMAPANLGVHDRLVFSSARKISAVAYSVAGKKRAVLLGAAEAVGGFAYISDATKKEVEQLSAQGLRVLLLAEFTSANEVLEDLSPQAKAIATGILVVQNDLRPGVKQTVQFLQERQVSIRVISGDNPLTVSAVAEQAGIAEPHNVMTGAELAELSDKDWDKKVLAATIFARVQPEQKSRIIQTFQKQKQFTAMVGDGVNDAIALKQADLGIAMLAGAAASRRVADLVILDNSFTSLPLGMKLGNRIMQAIELVATLFFFKIVYGIIILLSTLVALVPYPFSPIHKTFMNIFFVTLPTLLWTLFPPIAHDRINPEAFWSRTLGKAAPLAVMSGVVVATFYLLLLAGSDVVSAETRTATVMLATIVGASVVYMVPMLLHVARSQTLKFMRIGYTVATVTAGVVIIGTQFFRDFFNFSIPTAQILLIVFGIATAVVVAQFVLARWIAQRTEPSIAIE